jgi:hypothetical protein
MVEGELSVRVASAHLRKRLVLKVVAAEEAKGSALPHNQEGSVLYRGHGAFDYACGCCGLLLAIGVSPGMFQNLVFACGCGAWNQVS